MKQEILCVECSRETGMIKTEDLRITAEDVEEAGGVIVLPIPLPEEKRKVYGEALEQFHCDLCNHKIEKGEECVARSIIGYGQVYKPWEHNYVR
ncbi:hypothetical protein KAW18_02855 [candidate division WOR-3 bacterium]|nr:hypothetical protein [candidate division WOR-3 bacterium]